MRQVSRARWLLSGLMAGIVIDSIQYLLDSFVFSDNWDALAKVVTPDPAKAAFVLTSTKIGILMQLIGMAAGMLAVRLAMPHSRHQHAPARYAAIAWLLTYGLIGIAIFMISRGVADPAKRPVTLVQEVGFALSGLIACWAGLRFGNWVYRESEAVATEQMVEG